MAQVKTRKAQARLEDIEPREVSPVDRPANGHRFVIVKNEGGAAANEEPMATKTAAQKNTGGAPPPEQAQMAQGGAPPPPMADATKAPGEPPEGTGPESTNEPAGAALVLPMGAKTSLLGALQAVASRIAEIIESLNGATEAEGAEMPSEPIVSIADAAGAMANAVEPYVMKQAGSGMAPPAQGDTEVGKADGAWTPEYIDSLPDWSFLYVEPSTERDTDWRTLPLTNRRFPVRDHAGRLFLPMVVEAIAQIGAGGAPFLSDQRKRKLLLCLADCRLDEAMIAAYREEPMAPETGAELLAIAEMIAGVGGMGAAPAAAAPAPTAPATDSTVQAAAPPDMPAGEQPAATGSPIVAAMTGGYAFDALAKSCAKRIAEVASIGKAAVAKAAKLASISAEFKAAVAKLDEMAGEEEETDKAFPKKPKTEHVPGAPAAPVAETAAPADDVAKSLAAENERLKAELTTNKVALGKAEQELKAKRVELAKAERRVPGSNVAREEGDSVAKAAPAYIPPSRDLNDDFDREKQRGARS